MLSSFKFPKAQLCHSYWPTFSSEKYEKPLHNTTFHKEGAERTILQSLRQRAGRSLRTERSWRTKRAQRAQRALSTECLCPHLCHHQAPSRKTLTILQGQLTIQCSRFGEREEALLLSGGIFLMCSICLPLGQCPLWRCLGCLVCVLGPFWFWLQPFGPSVVGVLSDLHLHLFEWYLCLASCFCAVT